MAQVYDPVEEFDRALDASGLTDHKFITMNGLGPSALTEWRRNRSRMAPRWAVIQAKLLAKLLTLTGVPYTEVEDVVPANSFLRMTAVWGKNKWGEECWVFNNGEIFMEQFVPEASREHPLWSKLTPAQKFVWWQQEPGIPGTIEEFFEKWCKPA